MGFVAAVLVLVLQSANAEKFSYIPNGRYLVWLFYLYNSLSLQDGVGLTVRHLEATEPKDMDYFASFACRKGKMKASQKG